MRTKVAKTQKEVFLKSEADAWFNRNRDALTQVDYPNSPMITTIEDLVQHSEMGSNVSILEIGCGDGGKLAHLAKNKNLKVKGLEPSELAVGAARAKGVDVTRGTADKLPFEDKSFDIIVFGFCLYLCDREDLFKIAQEACRVLKDKSWLVIQDFYAETPIKNAYHHRPGIFSYKMDYRKLFDWHPNFTCFSHHVSAHGEKNFTDESNEWVAISVLRKNSGHE
jgi:SAM-dependent methyltransferase